MKERNEKDAAENSSDTRYDEELLSANWNPVIALLAASCARTAAEARRSATEALREEEAAAFLGRIYTLG